MGLSTKDYLKAEKLVHDKNEATLKKIGAEHGQEILDEIEYELFADTGSVGIHEIVNEPKGEHKRSDHVNHLTGLEKLIKDAWFDFTAWVCEYTNDPFDYSCYLKIKDGIYFKYNAIK